MYSASGFDLTVAQIHGDMFNNQLQVLKHSKVVQGVEKNFQNLRSETIKHLPPDFLWSEGSKQQADLSQPAVGLSQEHLSSTLRALPSSYLQVNPQMAPQLLYSTPQVWNAASTSQSGSASSTPSPGM